MPLLISGLAGLVTAFWGLYRDVGFLAQPFYAWAWWSYIFLLDGFVALRRRGSLFTTRRTLLLPILVWSVTFWFFFELLNLRFQNWYYVGVFARGSGPDLLAGPLFGVLSFATVFTGIFETHDALGALGVFSRARIRPRPLPRWVRFVVQGSGFLMVGAALLSSHYLAPLVWGSVTFLLDPWNYRRGARSLLADVEAGDLRTIARLLLAGLLCGVVWESFNYFSPQKWIYTVRGLDELKLFEMPLLGFLGFPALALDAFTFFSFVSYWIHGNRTWENPEDLSQRLEPRPAISAGGFGLSLPLHLAFWGMTAFAMQWVNVGSTELSLRDLESLPPEARSVLERMGIDRPRRLLRAIDEPGPASGLARELGLTTDELAAIRDELELFTFKGIGRDHGEILRRVGVEDVGDLSRAEPEELYRRLSSARGDQKFPALRFEMVRVWVHAARERSGGSLTDGLF